MIINRRSFLSFLACVPVLGRIVPDSEDVTIDDYNALVHVGLRAEKRRQCRTAAEARSAVELIALEEQTTTESVRKRLSQTMRSALTETPPHA